MHVSIVSDGRPGFRDWMTDRRKSPNLRQAEGSILILCTKLTELSDLSMARTPASSVAVGLPSKVTFMFLKTFLPRCFVFLSLRAASGVRRRNTMHKVMTSSSLSFVEIHLSPVQSKEPGFCGKGPVSIRLTSPLDSEVLSSSADFPVLKTFSFLY